MPDVPRRGEIEDSLYNALSGAMLSQYARLRRMWRDNPNLDDLDLDYWETVSSELRQVLDPALTRVYVDQGALLQAELGIGVADWARYNAMAIEWVNRYNYDLVAGINSTTERLIRSALDAFYRDGIPLDEVAEMLSAFGPVRARTIAITEITRASVHGELGLVNMLADEIPGLRWHTTWETANDDRVCPICAPLRGREVTTSTPPAHPNCRCWLNHAIMEPSS